MTGTGVSSSAPLSCSVGAPEPSQSCVAIEVDDNHVGTAGILCLAMPVNKMSRTPTIASSDPPQKPVQVFVNVRPVLGYFLRVLFVLAALVNCYLQLHYYLQCYGTVRTA